ncbi:MAG: DapH/DapD/GlmU-related protein [Sulfuricellaceae bacterium]
MHLISPLANISPLADLEDSVRGSRLIVEDGVMIDAFVKIKFTGGMGDVRIGRNSYVNSGVVIYSGNGVTLGEDVLIAANCTFAPVSHEFKSRDKKIVEQGFKPGKGGIIVENDVWIGANCVILDGAVLRRGCVVGAGSLVRGELASYSINLGNPLVVVGYRE